MGRTLSSGIKTITATGTGLAMISGTISGSGGISKAGANKLTLSAANTYTGATTVSAGTLALIGSGSIANSSSIAVNAGATLDASGRSDGTLAVGAAQALTGSGTVIANTIISGTLAPGAPAGVLSNIGNLTLASGSQTLMEIGGTARGISYDGVDITGSLANGGTLTISLINGYSGAGGDTFNLFNANSYSGTFGAVNLPTLGGELSWDTSALESAGRLVVVPEPSTWALLGFGTLLLAGWKRRQTIKS